MPRIPDASTLGSRPAPTSRRGIVSVDNGQVARALTGAGGVIANFGADMRDQEIRQQQKQDRFEGARARSYLTRESIEAAAALDDDQDYGTHESRYSERMQKAREGALKLISDPEERALFDEEASTDYTRGLEQVRTKAKAREREYGLTTLQQSLDDNDAAAMQADSAQSGKLLGLNSQLIDSAVARGYLDPTDAYKTKRDRALKFAEGKADAMVATDPDSIVRMLAPKGDKPIGAVADSDRDLAIRTIYGEARGESPEGQAAVANVILNRQASGRWGATIGDVVKAKGQFEPWGNAKTRAEMEALKPGEPAYDAIGEVFDQVATGKIPDITAGATHFVSGSTQVAMGRQMPEWAKNKLADVGNHSFYAPEGAVSSRASIPAKTGTVLDILPGDVRLKKYQEAARTSIEAAMLSDPLKASSMLDEPEYRAALPAADIAKYQATARERFSQLQEVAKSQRIMETAKANSDIFQKAVGGTLTLPQLAQAESQGLDKEFSGYLRQALMVKPEQKSDGEQAAAYTDFASRLDQAISKRGTSGAKYKGGVEEFLVLQRDLLRLKNDGSLSPRDVTTFMSQINRGVQKKLPSAGSDPWYDLASNDTPYETGFKAIKSWVDSHGYAKNPVAKAEIMRRFAYSVSDAEQNQQAVDAPTMAKAAIESYAKSKFPVLSMMDGVPSAVVSGGERTATAPQGTAKPTASVKAGTVKRDKNGNYARVFDDGTYEMLSADEAKRFQATGR